MSWIKTISYEASTKKLRKLYDRVKGPKNNVDNIMMLHSLRPHSMEGHMAIYKYVLHHSSNTLPKWFLESLGVWVSILNKCQYCVDHHYAGLKRLMLDDVRSDALKKSFLAGEIYSAPLTAKQKTAVLYAKKLTLDPAALRETDIIEMREQGYNDGEILEINQVCSYFCYANRTVLGLGCNLDGDVLGLSPNNSDDPNDWSHG